MMTDRENRRPAGRLIRSALIPVVTLFGSACLADQVRMPDTVDAEVRQWRRFMADIHALHRRLIAGREVRIARSRGGYARQPGFYREALYTDAATGRLISRLQWEAEAPDRLHSIEVFIRDRQGRVIRDYSAWYLPGFRNAPKAATVSLYAYTGELTAFRSFDASDVLVTEVCRGRYAGKDVDIALDEFERIHEERKPGGGVLGSPLYRLCFRNLPLKSAGRYLRPQ